MAFTGKVVSGGRNAIMARMRCSSRYIFSQTFWPLVFVAIAIAGVIWLTQSLRFMDLIMNRGLPVTTFLHLIALVMPMMMSVVLPVALFSAVIFAYTKMTMDSELVVLRACGLTHMALARPALLLAVLVTLLSYALTIYLMPLAYRHFKDLQYSIRYNSSAVILQEGVFNNFANGVTVYVRARSSAGELLGILIHDERIPSKPITMMAERGALIQTAQGPRVVMINGNRQVVEHKRNNLSLVDFDSYTFDLGKATLPPGTRWRDPRERYLHELFFPGGSEMDRKHMARLRAEGHQRLASPLLALAFALVGLASLLSGQFNRRGQFKRILLASILVLILQTTSIGLHSLAKALPGIIPLMYIIPLAAIVAACYVLVRQPSRRGSSFIRKLHSRV